MYLYEKLALIEKEKKEKEEREKKLIPAESNVDRRKYVSLMTSMSHTYGNALAFIQNWVLNDIFPENMFKTIHVNSKIAHRQIRSTPHEYIKKTKPMIIFRPRIPGYNEDRFLKGTPLIERQMDIKSSWGMTSLQPFFHDPENNLSISYQLNRTVMYVDVVVVLSTLMQQLDYYHYIVNATRLDRPFILQTCMESYMPQEMLAILGNLGHVPLYDENGSTKEFLDYMNGHSFYPITYKLQGSTNSREFYRYYPVNIDTMITDLDKDEGERVGNIMNQYTISFSIRMEFNSTGFYYIFSDKIYDLKLPKIDPENSSIIPVFTDVYNKEDLNLAQGWSLYNRASYRLETPDDVVNLNQLLNMSIQEAIKYYKDNGLPLLDIIDIKVRKQGKPVRNGEEYTLNWDTLDITFNNQDTYHTFSILICINVEQINNLIKVVYNLK